MENLLLKHSQEEKEKLIKQINARFRLSKGYYADKHDLWEKCYKLYRCISDEAETDEPDIKIAFIYGIVEKIVSKLVAPFSGKLSIQVKPKQITHTRKGENFYEICKDFFNSAFHKIEYVKACRQRTITGTSWEIDEWLNEWEDGWRWAINKINQAIEVNLPTLKSVIQPIVNAASKIIRNTPVSKYMRVKHKFPVNVGYNTRYPSVFRMFPQPGMLKVEDLKWIIEEVPFVALEDLEKAKYFDPETNEMKPVYDLSYFQKMKKDEPEKIIIPVAPEGTESRENFETEYSGVGKDDKSQASVDGLHLLIMRTPREIYVLANGIAVIQSLKDPFHKPGLRIRCRVYTPDDFSIYGFGAIEPIIPMIEELDDVHNMCMQNWIRIINKMLAYDEGAIPYPDDFEPRAGGKIRAKDGVDLPRAIMPIDQQDVTGTMITTESNLRGLIETILAVADFAPGAMGTKPYHTTMGGLIELQQSFAQRFTTLLLQDQAQTMKQMESMYWLYDQFMFEPVDVQGTFGAVKYTREDIDTDGLGFYFVASDDPSFGDTAVQRNQNMVLLQSGLNYESTRMNLRKFNWREVRCDRIMEDVLLSFKHSEATDYLVEPNGSVSPQDEFKYILQNVPVEVNPKENLVEHFLAHLMQMRNIEQGVEKYPPEIVSALSNHIADTQTMLQNVIEQPEQFVDEAVKRQITQEQIQPVPAVNLGQNLPIVQGAGAEKE